MYDVDIKNLQQPMIITKAKKKDLNRRNADVGNLIYELKSFYHQYYFKFTGFRYLLLGSGALQFNRTD